MFCFLLHLAVFSMLAGAAATNQAFPSSGMMNITSCPITYYGQKYDKVYIGQVELGNFGTQAVLGIKTYSGYTNVDVEADALVNGLTVSTLKFQTAQTNKGVITDMSGCRLSGVVYKTNTTVKDPNICSTVTCDVSGVATAVSDCGPMERCQGNGSCILNTVCTVAGSIVIDFIGRVHSVSDRCGYTLLKPSLIPGFQVFGVFQERRRRDVSFVDRVILQLDGKGLQISLEQGRRVQANNSQIIYKNTIMTQNISMLGPITRHGPVHIDFSCYYSHPDVKSLAIKLKHSSVNREIASGEYIYNLTMKAYTSADRLKAIESSTDIKLNEQLWVELKTDGLDEKMVAVVTAPCWATNQPSPTGSLRYDLIINGCPNPTDETVKMEENGLGTSKYFSFNMFQFTGKTGDVYLHCKVVLCFRQGNTCTPSCSQGERRRRSTMPNYEDKYPAFIIMAWTS